MTRENDGAIQAEQLLDRLREATLGEFEILGEAGRGGMAVVYLAHDIALDRKVAIKVISPDILWMGAGIAERFKREARVSASLSHPHIIPIYAVKESDDLLYFVMQFVRGRTLDEVIEEVGPLPPAMVHTILMQVGGALGYAHRKGVVHRDIKPGNIMLDEEGWAVVTDFGIAKVDAAEDLTQAGSAVGTPAYMSPEQCSGLPATGASDQYALGVVAYKMLTGDKPFDAESTVALMYKHLHTPPEPVHVKVPECPLGLSQIVMRMLEKSPADRWPQMEELVAALGVVPQGESGEVRTQMLQLARSTSAQAIVERFRTPISPVPRNGPPVSAPPDAGGTPITRPPDTGAAADSDPAGSPALAPRWRRRVAWAAAPVGAVALALLLLGHWRLGDTNADPAPPPPAEAGTTVAAAPAVAELEVVPTARMLSVGEVAELSLVARDGDGDPVDVEGAVWSSGDPRIAVVSGAGVVTAIGAGSTEITAMAGARTASTRLTVIEDGEPTAASPAAVPVATVSVTPTSGSLAVGETLRPQVTLRDARGASLAGRTVAWSSSDPSVVRVTQDGVVSAVGAGVASVTAISEGRAQSIAVRVTAPRTVTAIAITPASRSLEPGESVRLTAAARDQAGVVLPDAPVTWSSGDPRVARVSGRGEVTAVAEGSARVTATSGAVTGSAEIVVAAAPTPVAVDHRPAIESVVAEYARAIERQDLPAAREIYPAMPAQAMERWTGFFAAVRELRVSMAVQHVSVEGDVANARVEMTLEFRDTRRQRETSQVPMTLRQEGGVWRILEIQ